ncbi:MAG: acyltransferase [Actinomycetota bacterium]
MATTDRISAIGVDKMGYRPALDGLRSVAIGLVLLEHTGLELFDGGNSGVIVFFVLSGFLITKLMLEEWGKTNGLNIKAFYGRRTVRIMPAPLVMVAVVFAFSWHIMPDEADRRYLWFELALVVLYIYNLRPILFGDGGWFGAERSLDTTTYMAHTWSLAVEEHFYLVWPWLLRRLRLPELNPEKVVKGLLGFLAAVTIFRFIFDRFVDPDIVSISLFTFDGFALGASMAFMFHYGLWQELRNWLRLEFMAIGALLLLTVDLLLRDQRYDGVTYSYYYITYCAVASAVLIAYLYDNTTGPVAKLMAWAPVVYIGKLSYSLYLWHVPVQVYISKDRFPEWSTFQIIVVEQVLTFAAVLASYYGIEMPAKRLRKYFVVSDKKPESGSGPEAGPQNLVTGQG